MNIPADLKYTKSHEWLKMEGDVAVIGITDYAQDQLGDIVFLELAGIGKKVEAGKEFGSIESVKSVSELIAPVSGEVVALNDELVKRPETVNSSPYEKGWMIKVKLSDPKELESLLPSEAYKSFVTEEV
jgi:glycine cleavage system H protein